MPRPRLQFGLRTLLIAIAVLAVTCWVVFFGKQWLLGHRLHFRDEYYDDDGNRLAISPDGAPTGR